MSTTVAISSAPMIHGPPCDMSLSMAYRDQIETKLLTIGMAITTAEREINRRRNHVNWEIMALFATGELTIAPKNAFIENIPATRGRLMAEMNEQIDKLKELTKGLERVKRDVATAGDGSLYRERIDSNVKELEDGIQAIMGERWCSKNIGQKKSIAKLAFTGSFKTFTRSVWF